MCNLEEGKERNDEGLKETMGEEYRRGEKTFD